MGPETAEGLAEIAGDRRARTPSKIEQRRTGRRGEQVNRPRGAKLRPRKPRWPATRDAARHAEAEARAVDIGGDR